MDLYDSNSVYYNNGAMRGAIYYCEGCSLYVEFSTFDQNYCFQGCIVYQDFLLENSYVEIYESFFNNTLPKYTGGLAKIDTTTILKGYFTFNQCTYVMDMVDIENYIGVSSGDKFTSIVLQISKVPTVSVTNSIFNYTNLDIESTAEDITRFENIYLGLTINFASDKVNFYNNIY